MSQENKIRMAAANKKMSLAELSRKIGQSPSNFHQKLKRNTFTEKELEQIAEVLGAKYVPMKFIFKDGTEI